MNLGNVVILGATGQTGSAVLSELLAGPDQKATKIVAYGNSRKPNLSGPLASQAVAMQASMADLATSRSDELKGFDSIFFHIGTQRRKAGLEAQIKLELDDTLAVARAALAGGCKQCHIISSTAASSSSFATYLRTKGQVEEELKKLGFERLVIYRPGALNGGDRATWFHKKCLPYIAAVGLVTMIDVADVGRCVCATALRSPRAPVEVLENAEMIAVARAAK